MQTKKLFPVWLKLALTLYIMVFIPVYWVIQGPANFLWLCDVALFLALAALWLESRLLASVVLAGSLLPELIWNMDALFRLLSGRHLFDLNATAYMFAQSTAPAIRVLSLFHVFLPMLAIWMVSRLGYDGRALLIQTLIAWLVLPLSYAVSSPSANVNWVFGVGEALSISYAPYLFVVLQMVVLPVVAYLPAHFLLKHWFSGKT